MKYFFLAIVVMISIMSCKKEHSCEGCDGNRSVNQPPVAIASWDSLNNLPAGSKMVTAKNSTDPDGVIVLYKWTKIGGPASYTILDSLSVQTIISNLVNGTYFFELAVTDNGGLTAKDTIQVIVNSTPANMTLKANAGPDQTLNLPLDSTYLDGSASSPNGFTGSASTTFRWTKIAGPAQYVLNPTSLPVTALAKTTVIAGDLVPGLYFFTFTVTAPGIGSATDTMKVTVIDEPQNRNTVTYHDLIWQPADPSGLSWLTTFLSSPLRPDIFDNAGVNRGVEISLKLNASSPWTIVPFRTHDPFNSDVVAYLAAILTTPNNRLLVGTRSDMRIRF